MISQKKKSLLSVSNVTDKYSDRPNSARGKEKRLRAVRVLADTEQILPGFISRYELSFDLEDIQLARRYLN